MDFFENYNFAIVFENSKHLGYCTENFTDDWNSGTIPIFWEDDSILDIRIWRKDKTYNKNR